MSAEGGELEAITNGLLAGYTVQPDPEPEDSRATDESNRLEALFATMVDRGCPKKLAREVSKLRDGHEVQSTHALEAVLGWAMIEPGQVGRECCVLSGERGRGKSYAAAQALARTPMGSGLPRWANARHIGTWLHTAGHDPLARYNIQRLSVANLLVIDDMGWEHFDRGGYSQGAFVGIIDDRIQDENRTIMTTNMDEAGFRSRYGDALHDRVRGYGLWVDVEAGPSLR